MRRYTPDDRRTAQLLLAAGEPRHVVIERTGVPSSTLSMWVTKYQWEFVSHRAVAYTDATRETILRDVDRGTPIAAVSRLTGVSRKTIYRWLRSRGTGKEAPALRRCHCSEYGTLVPAGDVCPRCHT